MNLINKIQKIIELNAIVDETEEELINNYKGKFLLLNYGKYINEEVYIDDINGMEEDIKFIGYGNEEETDWVDSINFTEFIKLANDRKILFNS